MKAALQAICIASLVTLIFLSLAWELWLAPLRAGGSWLVLKALPLLLPLRGVLAGTTYTYRWSILLIQAYVVEGLVRAHAEGPPVSTLAALELLLALVFFASAIAYIRTAR